MNEAPGIIRHFPQDVRDRWNERNLSATAIVWLRPRLTNVPVDQCRSILAARRDGNGVALELDNGNKISITCCWPPATASTSTR